MSVDIPAFFEKYEWSAQQVDADVWAASFATAHEEDFDLYVATSTDWVHFAVSPLIPLPLTECTEELHNAMLHLNQQIRLVRFGLDEDGDVNLLADLPREGMSYATFATVLDTLVYYTEELAHELARTASEVGYQSTKF